VEPAAAALRVMIRVSIRQNVTESTAALGRRAKNGRDTATESDSVQLPYREHSLETGG